MLKGTMKILEKIMNDNFLSLSEEDKISAQKMFEEGYVDEKKDDDKKNDNEEKKHKGDNDNFKRENQFSFVETFLNNMIHNKLNPNGKKH